MFNLISRLNSSDFYKNVLKLMTGTIIAQSLSFATQPILTRLFTPGDYGKLASIQAIISIFTVFCALSYERAIVLTPSSEEANAVAGLSAQLTIILGVGFSLIILNPSIWHLMFGFALPIYIKLLIAIWFIGAGLSGVFYNLHNRAKNYSFLAKNRVLVGVFGISVQIIAGYSQMGANGLILANILVAIVGLVLVSFTYLSPVVFKIMTNYKSYAIKYVKFPHYQLPSSILDVASLQIMVVLLNRFLGPDIAGQYSLANRVLAIPLSLIGGAFAQVFYQEFVKRFSENDDPKGFLLRTWQKLFLLGILPCSVLFFGGEPIFQLVFGAKWLMAGWFAKYLCLMSFIMLISSPTSSAFMVIGLQKFHLIFGILLFMVRIITVIIMQYNMRGGLIAYIACESLVILLYNRLILKKLNEKIY